MATTKPRITVTLEPALYEVVSRLARASSQTMSGVIGDFLQVAEGPMRRAVSILERAGQAEDQAKRSIRGSLARAESVMLPAILEGLDQLSLQLGEEGLSANDLVRRSSAATARAAEPPARAARRRSPPVPVTRGVGSPKQAKKQAKKRSGRA